MTKETLRVSTQIDQGVLMCPNLWIYMVHSISDDDDYLPVPLGGKYLTSSVMILSFRADCS